MDITMTDAEGFDRHSQHADLAIILISRADIEAMRVSSTVERLMLLSEDAEQVFRFAGRVVLQINGYDDDPRPLVQIPECVRFFRAVDAQWRYWLHFLLPIPDQLQLIVLMLIDLQVQEKRGHRSATRYGTPSNWSACSKACSTQRVCCTAPMVFPRCWAK